MDIKIIENLELTKRNGIDVVKSLNETGCLIIRDSIVSEDENNRFLDLMERYFEQTDEMKLKDARPELGYQVGVTPEGIEVSICVKDTKCQSKLQEQDESDRAQIPSGADPKWRYFWKIENKDKNENVIPEVFKDEWEEPMNKWGAKMLTVIKKVTKLIELGLELETGSLLNLLSGGSHLLAPTGTNIEKYNEINTIYAGYHYDISFLTIHGKSRYPGLNIWTREGNKKEVKVPDGCLILQVGKQLEWLTGGYFEAGYHEVICKESTLNKLQTNKSEWRVSSTLFAHVNSEMYLEPIDKFRNEITEAMYPKIKEGKFIENELKETNLL